MVVSSPIYVHAGAFASWHGDRVPLSGCMYVSCMLKAQLLYPVVRRKDVSCLVEVMPYLVTDIVLCMAYTRMESELWTWKLD